MSVVEPGSARSKLMTRVKDMLIRPSATWDAIEAEAATPGDLFKSYAAPLAAVPAVCGLIGTLAFGVGAFGVSYRPAVGSALAEAIVGYVLNLALIYLLALIIDALAPNFGGTRNRIQAFKLAIYASTASWVVGVFALAPMLGFLAAVLGGLYSLYTLYVGLPKLMKSPLEKTLPYFAVILLLAVVGSMLIGTITSRIVEMGGPLSMAQSRPEDATINLPGEATINLGKLEAQAKQAQLAAAAIEAGKAKPAADTEVLKAYLPTTVAGFTRTEISAASSKVAGMDSANAEAVYEKAGANLRLSVQDIGQAGALAGLAGSLNLKSSKETKDSYEKIGTVDGRMTEEAYDRANKHGKYSVMVGERFMVEASGDGVTMDELKAAVGAVGFERLEGLAKAG